MKKIHLFIRDLRAAIIIFISLLILTASVGSLYAQSAVRGKITDTKGDPIVGAIVSVKGSSNYVYSDVNGVFSINVANGRVLQFSYLGMVSQEVTVSNRAVINIVMQEEASRLDDVIVVGYGTQQRSSLTGSISQIKGSELLKTPSTNISSVLGGRVAGLSSVQESGQPGADFAGLRIRGSRAGVAYIVDGMPRSIKIGRAHV